MTEGELPAQELRISILVLVLLAAEIGLLSLLGWAVS